MTDCKIEVQTDYILSLKIWLYFPEEEKEWVQPNYRNHNLFPVDEIQQSHVLCYRHEHQYDEQLNHENKLWELYR